nr:Chain P, Dodecapeptide, RLLIADPPSPRE [synthetic construct]
RLLIADPPSPRE